MGVCRHTIDNWIKLGKGYYIKGDYMNEQMFKSITRLRMSMLMFYKLYYK